MPLEKVARELLGVAEIMFDFIKNHSHAVDEGARCDKENGFIIVFRVTLAKDDRKLHGGTCKICF